MTRTPPGPILTLLMLAAFIDSLSDEAREEFFALVRAEVETALASVRSDGEPPWLSVAEAAERLGVSEGSIRKAVERGKVPSHHFERRILLRSEDVDALPTRSG